MSTTTTPTALQDAILDTLRIHFGARVNTVDLYWPFDPEDGPAPHLQTPALLLRLERQEREPLDLDPTGRLRMRVSFALYCILSLRTPRLYVELPEMTLHAIRCIDPPSGANRRGQDWGLGAYVVEPAEAITDDEAEFSAAPTGTDSRVVRWEHVVAYANTLEDPAP
jgi:hypothetical protein